jgi:predicted GTPase
VHPIHRVVALGWTRILELTEGAAEVSEPMPVAAAEKLLAQTDGFAVALAHEDEAVVLSRLSDEVAREALGADADTALGKLDITVLHRVLVERVWQLSDTVDNVGYAHSVTEALEQALPAGRTAVLVRATPVQAVAEVAAAGARMPRKSTLFTPKPASGMVLRRFADQ